MRAADAPRNAFPPPLPLVPWPQEVARQEGRTGIDGAPEILAPRALEPMAKVLTWNLERLLAGDRTEAARGPVRGSGTAVHLQLAAGEAGYRLQVADNRVVITAAEPVGIAWGMSTLVQLLQVEEGRLWLPRVEVEDRPALPYRGVMIDCARNPQPTSTLRQVIDLCWLLKVRYLQLHLTDNPAFTFPSTAFPNLATRDHSYSLRQLQDLEAHAQARGVVLVPELDVPGHSKALVAAMPRLFALRDAAGNIRNNAVLNMGREEVYRALDTLVGEVCDVFRSSPYVHIGGDEVWLAHVKADPDCQACMKQHGLRTARELYRHFILRMHGIVQRHGRQAVCWEGFGRGGQPVMPRDLIVMGWDSGYQRPDQLLEDGFRVINSTWQPLYIVGGGKGGSPDSAERAFAPQHIHGWNPWRWEHWQEKRPAFHPIDLSQDQDLRQNILGAQVCVWEQLPASVIPTLRERLAAFAERTWNPDCRRSFEDFAERFQILSPRIDRILRARR